MSIEDSADAGKQGATHRARAFLAVSVVVTVALYYLPYGRTLAWPFVLFSTLVHELGHGIAAMLAGGRFEALLMWSDGSGVATWTALVGRFGHAAIAAGGLLGPAIVAAVCFTAGRRPQTARMFLFAMGAVLVLVDVVVVRTLFGVFFVLVVASGCIALGLYARPWLARLATVFIGVQLALSVFSRADYLFTAVAATSAGAMPSDTAQIAEALWLPYWFWGACCGLFSVAILLAGLMWAIREDG